MDITIKLKTAPPRANDYDGKTVVYAPIAEGFDHPHYSVELKVFAVSDDLKTKYTNVLYSFDDLKTLLRGLGDVEAIETIKPMKDKGT